jgi:hypothetical protein
VTFIYFDDALIQGLPESRTVETEEASSPFELRVHVVKVSDTTGGVVHGY